MSDYKVRDGSVILTQQELDALNAIVTAGDRAGFYILYNAMTDSGEALLQAKVATFSGAVGGAAFAANRFLQDQYGATGTVQAGLYPGIYYLSQQVALAAFNAIQSSADPTNGTGTGKIDDTTFYNTAAAAWRNNNVAQLFPGNLYSIFSTDWSNLLTPGAAAAFLATAYAGYVGKSPGNFGSTQTLANGYSVAVGANGEIQAVFGVVPSDRLVAAGATVAPDPDPNVIARLLNGTTPAAFSETNPPYNGDVNPIRTNSLDPQQYSFVSASPLTFADQAGDEIIIGGKSDEVLQGGSGNNIIWGRGGNDTLIAGDQNDILRGGSGNDTLIPGTGNDLLDGGDINVPLDQVGTDTVAYSNLPGGVTIDLTNQDAQKLNDDLIQVSKNANGNQDWLHAIKTIKLSNEAANTVRIGDAGLAALKYLQEIDAGQHTGGVQDKLDLQPLGKSITFDHDKILGYNTVFKNFNVFLADPGNDRIILDTSDDQSFKEVDFGDGNDMIKSDVVNLVINLGNGTDTIFTVGPGTVVNAGSGKDTFTVSNDELIAGTGDSPNDVIVTQGGLVLHGFVGPINSDNPWITSIYNGISYGLNNEGQLVIKDTLGNETFVAGYKGGPTVPLSQQTDGIFIGRGSFKSSRLMDLTRPAIEEDANVFKFGNEIAFVRLGHPEFPGNDDPLVLDLTGHGVNLTGETSVAPMFDMQGTGFAVHTGWTQPGTGLLVLQDADGQVKNVNQLIGGENNSGFAALAQYDANYDGVIDTNDPIFAQAQVSRGRHADVAGLRARLN